LAVKLRRYSEVDAERVRSPLPLQLSEVVVCGAVCV
jgi:hypothetical protein